MAQCKSQISGPSIRPRYGCVSVHHLGFAAGGHGASASPGCCPVAPSRPARRGRPARCRAAPTCSAACGTKKQTAAKFPCTRATRGRPHKDPGWPMADVVAKGGI
eukprot:6182824-Prymnesium_polylepis.1